MRLKYILEDKTLLQGHHVQLFLLWLKHTLEDSCEGRNLACNFLARPLPGGFLFSAHLQVYSIFRYVCAPHPHPPPNPAVYPGVDAEKSYSKCDQVENFQKLFPIRTKKEQGKKYPKMENL